MVIILLEEEALVIVLDPETFLLAVETSYLPATAPQEPHRLGLDVALEDLFVFAIRSSSL